MALYFYYAMFAISLVLAIVYAYMFHKRFDASIMMMTVLVPIINLAFIFMGQAKLIEEAIVALRFTYLGGCFLLVAVMFLIYNTCGVNIHPVIRGSIILVSSAVYATTLTIGKTNIFYVGMPDLAFSDGAAYITNKTYGPMHTVFYVMVVLYYLATLGVIIYSFFKRRQVPRTVLVLILISVTVAITGGILISVTVNITGRILIPVAAVATLRATVLATAVLASATVRARAATGLFLLLA